MKLFFFCLIAILFCCDTSGQTNQPGSRKKRPEYLAISVTNSHTAMPFRDFSELVYKEYHPGIEVSTGFNWTQKNKHSWFQTIKAGYSYHKFVQHSFMVYTEFGYRHKLPLSFSVNAKFGGGYMHSKEDSEVFILDENGEYKQSEKFGRSHPMATFSVGAGKQINKSGWEIFLDYQQRFQVSFIDAYVPVLPLNSMAIGVSMPMGKKNNR